MKEWLEKNLLRLNVTSTMNRLEGFNRPGYSDKEMEAVQEFIHLADSLDMQVQRDKAGNILAVWNPGNSEKSSIAFISHLDTVTNGGGYDGVAGVLCGLGVIQYLKEKSWIPSRPVTVICAASEESSRFGVSTIGSKAMAGLLNPVLQNDLIHLKDSDGTTLEEAVRSQGLDWNNMNLAEQPLEAFHRVVELHIEQGTKIENARKDIGIVRGIACPLRLSFVFTGEAGHTGTTPMNKRKDALAASAPFIQTVAETAKKIESASGEEIVATASTIECEPNEMNVIPGKVTIGVDIRSVNDKRKQEAGDILRTSAIELAKNQNIHLEIETLVNNASVLLSPEVSVELQEASVKAGCQYHSMDSGAGHDIMNIAEKWQAGLVFIPCREGKSHVPEEYASLEDLYKGVQVLANYVMIQTGELKA
ncbi:M20 family metallo-hydrolase [Marinococcus luteus]|nr:M20 family metallo-hydrolase [Marinococcus luteus]